MRKLENILLVEDTDDDVLLFERALRKAGIAKEQLHRVPHGAEAIQYLEGAGSFADRKKFPYPDVIFTDLKMPNLNGFEFLHWIKVNPTYQVIPTVVLSSSADQLDVKRAFYEGANCYFKKPNSLEELTQKIRQIIEFWSANELPNL